ncbi:arginase family protein [Leifsonia shinshuensis]|uniref:arginase family protein n=1 Tax=Leifsonia shinshuensis TaxID=150026 RepID=UPI001F5063C6|nr:arginase family protein [Leifsonia shinshuensis]MCI0157653.1 arginase family protein [Leifsonia shinshuensis]
MNSVVDLTSAPAAAASRPPDVGAPSRASVTAFVDGVSGHNDRARQATLALALELGRRLDTPASVVGEGSAAPARSLGWRAALQQSRPELDALGEMAARSLKSSRFSAFCVTRNAAAIATLPAVARAFPDAAVVWMGAHPCLHTPGTTRTGDLSGMALAGATGLWSSGHGGGLALSNVILLGARDLDRAEKHVIANSPIRQVATGPRLQEELAATIAGRDVFVHFSADVLRPGIVPTDFQVADGLTIDTVAATARTLAGERVVGLEISELEHDPTDRFSTSAQLIVEMLTPLLPRG